MRRWFLLVVLVTAAAGSLGHGGGGCCSSGDDDDEGEEFICEGTESPATPGASTSGAVYTITIVEATPALPSVQGNDDVDGDPTGLNTLSVTLTDDQDAPVEGATFALIEPFANRHDHGTPVVAQWAEVGGGDYDLTDINYVHRGPWQLNLQIDDGGAMDTLQFVFCIRDYGFEDGGAGGL